MMTTLLRRVCCAVLILAGAATFAVLVLPKLFGWNAYVVTSGSMAPTVDAGAVVVAAPVDPEDIMTGDIVTFVDPSGLTTHRVVGMTSSSHAGKASRIFITKGDANEEPDPAELHPQNIVGKAKFGVPNLGFLVSFVKAPLGAGIFAALVLFVVFTGDGLRKPVRTQPVRDETEPVLVS